MIRYLFFIFMIIPILVMSQNSSLLFRVGVATFNMKTQKEFQKGFMQSTDLPLKPVHTFPAYLTFGGEVAFKTFDQSAMGLWIDYTSTGGTLHYKDYSGYARMDQLMKCLQPGFFYQRQINTSSMWPFFITSHFSVVFSRETIRTELVVGATQAVEQIALKSVNFGFRPGVMLQRKFDKFVAQANLGYELHSNGQLKTDDDTVLTTPDGKDLAVQWGGLRFGVGFGVLLNVKKSKAALEE